MAPELTITRGELLEALARAAPGAGPSKARTVVEMVRETKMSETHIRRALKAHQEHGRLRVHRVIRPALDGRQCVVPAYTILPTKRK